MDWIAILEAEGLQLSTDSYLICSSLGGSSNTILQLMAETGRNIEYSCYIYLFYVLLYYVS